MVRVWDDFFAWRGEKRGFWAGNGENFFYFCALGVARKWSRMRIACSARFALSRRRGIIEVAFEGARSQSMPSTRSGRWSEDDRVPVGSGSWAGTCQPATVRTGDPWDGVVHDPFPGRPHRMV